MLCDDPVGPQPVVDTSKALGVMLRGAKPQRGGGVRRAMGKRTNVAKALHKALGRANAIIGKGASSTLGIIHWNSYVLSCLPFTASLEGMCGDQMRQLYQARAKATHTHRKYLAKHVTGILRHIGALQALDPEVGIGEAVVGAALRLRGLG